MKLIIGALPSGTGQVLKRTGFSTKDAARRRREIDMHRWLRRLWLHLNLEHELRAQLNVAWCAR